MSVLNNLGVIDLKLNNYRTGVGYLKKSISINKFASIFFYVESNSIQKMRFVITGPIDTPYSYGLFVFDNRLNVPSEYSLGGWLSNLFCICER